MSEKNLKIGQKVEILGKNVRGEIAYIGMTTFAVGKWVGVILNEAKGKNNGNIKGTQYFTCADNHGMFVRPTQLITLNDAGMPIEDLSSDEKPEPARRSLSSSSSVRSVASTTKPTTVRRKSPVKTMQTKKQTNSMVSSTSSSRLSLVGSRQSLLGSRTQLTSPGTERPPTAQSVRSDRNADNAKDKRTTISPPEFAASSKRESFVETGFLETLRPQFTVATTSLSSPALTAEERAAAQAHQQENEELKSKVNDLQEKLETLKQRRNEDKERLREFDKMKTQFDQLQEFKSKIMDAQSQLQRELQRSKQETRDAIESKNSYMEEMSELAENVEMITLDKEMAEEKSDTLQLELDAANERIEELQLDNEILKAEMQNYATNVGSGGVAKMIDVTSYEFKQLEQQNVRLRETLVRLRDLSAHEKHEIQKVTKELETKKSETLELHRTKEKLSSKIDELEAQVVDLKEQVDAALGAEEMVEQLADKKMELEDKVKLLEEEVAELEALEEVHEQLVESNHELELDLREELDMALADKREMMREKDAAFETILDRDQTIIKFRELVGKLNEQILNLREKANTMEPLKDDKEPTITETIDFKKMFAESKAYTRAIDLQIRQIELAQSNEHVRLLSAFMPDTFMNRGGDHDAILVILLLSRIAYKVGIVVSQTRDRFPEVEMIDRTTILQGHTVQQFAFKSRLLYHVHNLQAIMHQFVYGVNACSPETLLKMGSSLPEMQAQEKIIDSIIELLKANQLDENSSTDNLEKCVTFFNAMYSVLFINENLQNEVQLVRDCNAAIMAACDSIGTDSALLRALIKSGDETSESDLLLQYVVQSSDTVKQQMKLIKRRLPQDPSINKCGLSPKTIGNLKQTSDQLGKAMTSLLITAKLVLQTIALSAADSDQSITAQKLSESMALAFEKVYEQEDRGPSQNLRTILNSAVTEATQLAQYLHDNEYEIHSKPDQKEQICAPIVLRAKFIKKQLEETKTLTATLENREAEIRQLKLAAKMKQNELSEMQIRKDLAEKKLSVLQNDHEVNTEKLQRQLSEVMDTLKTKEKEFEDTLDHLQNDIDTLESERGALRDKLKIYNSKKGDLKATTAFDITSNSPYIAQELSLLKKAFHDERSERMKLQAIEMRKLLDNLTPIYVPKRNDNKIIELTKELVNVKNDYIFSLCERAGFPDIKKSQNTNLTKLLNDHRNRQKIMREDVENRARCLANNVMEEYFNRKPYRSIKTDLAEFPTVELTRAMKG